MIWHCKDCKKRHIGCRKDCEDWAADCAAAAAERQRRWEATSQERLTTAYYRASFKKHRPKHRPKKGDEKR